MAAQVTAAAGSLRPGLVFEYRGNRCMVHALGNGQCTYRLMGDTALQVAEVNDLATHMGRQQPVIDLTQYTSHDWRRAKKLAHDCATVIAQNITDVGELQKKAKRHKIEIEQFSRYLKRYRENPFVSSCLRLRPGRLPGSHELDEAVEAIIAEVVHDEVFKEEATTIKEIHRLVPTIEVRGFHSMPVSWRN